MKFYEAAERSIRLGIEQGQIQYALDDSGFDPDSQENRDRLAEIVRKTAFQMGIGILCRLQVLDDPENDQAQASIREFIGIMAKRNGVDAVNDLGIPL